MTVCPIAIVAGCKKCPVFKICPAKGLLGDQPAQPPKSEAAPQRKPTKAKK